MTTATQPTAADIWIPDRRLALLALTMATAMIVVGIPLSALGVFLLEVLGGAASDTTLVVVMGAFAATDFWGAGTIAALRKVSSPHSVALSWAGARLVLLSLAVLLTDFHLLWLVIQVAVAFGAAWLGVRAGQNQRADRMARAAR